jgi:phosphoglycolate phosphatase
LYKKHTLHIFATLAGMNHKAILFDLDGTLLDTLKDLTCACNHVLELNGQGPITTADCRRMVGNGARVLLQRVTGLDGADLDTALQQFLDHYEEHKFDYTTLYAGIQDLLDSLSERGVRLAILSNKPHPATTELARQLLANWPFEHVFGQRDGVPLKPDPTAALSICKAMDLPPEHCVFVGDSGEDMATGKAAGMFAVGVTWGFRDEPELHKHGTDAVIHQPMQLFDVLSK